MRHRHIGNAFTLIELLVVVAIIVALLAILLPSMNRAVESAVRAVCASQTHQLYLAEMNYAAENHGALASSPGNAGNWMWDLNSDTARKLIEYGAGGTEQEEGDKRGVFYCPNQEKLRDSTFWFGGSFDGNGFIIGGYSFYVKHTGGGALSGGPAMSNGYEWLTSISATRRPATSPVFTDNVCQQAGAWTNFGTLGAGQTAHMAGTNVEPAGGNNHYMDGSVRWRGYDEMTLNIITGGNVFWYW